MGLRDLCAIATRVGPAISRVVVVTMEVIFDSLGIADNSVLAKQCLHRCLATRQCFRPVPSFETFPGDLHVIDRVPLIDPS